MKTLELTKDACRLLVEVIEHHILLLYCHNEIKSSENTSSITQAEIIDNNIKIGELKTLLDYIKVDL